MLISTSMQELKRGKLIDASSLAKLRSIGMHKIRFEFIMRLLRLNTQIITLSIYWENGQNFMNDSTVQNARRKLVFAGTPHVSGLFDDTAVICYPSDHEAKSLVNTELERMLDVIARHLNETSRH